VKRVVVTGLGMINSLGLDKESAFAAIVEGKCGIKVIVLVDCQILKKIQWYVQPEDQEEFLHSLFLLHL
jgi:3-oxoacyl-(acyl-carrier-protein) synthase